MPFPLLKPKERERVARGALGHGSVSHGLGRWSLLCMFGWLPCPWPMAPPFLSKRGVSEFTHPPLLEMIYDVDVLMLMLDMVHGLDALA